MFSFNYFEFNAEYHSRTAVISKNSARHVKVRELAKFGVLCKQIHYSFILWDQVLGNFLKLPLEEYLIIRYLKVCLDYLISHVSMMKM
jgi:hypothetical protein